MQCKYNIWQHIRCVKVKGFLISHAKYLVSCVPVILTCIFQIYVQNVNIELRYLIQPLSPSKANSFFIWAQKERGHDARDLASRVVESSLKEHNNPANWATRDGNLSTETGETSQGRDESEIKSGPTPCVTNLISTGTNCIKSPKNKGWKGRNQSGEHTLYKRSRDGITLIWRALILITARSAPAYGLAKLIISCKRANKFEIIAEGWGKQLQRCKDPSCPTSTSRAWL